MKNNMQVMYPTLTSMEVAKMVEKRHGNLIRSISMCHDCQGKL